jgi:type II secretory pathway pseudopilin PulG
MLRTYAPAMLGLLAVSATAGWVRQRRQVRVAIVMLVALHRQRNQLRHVVAAHGCAPSGPTLAGTTHVCDHCGTRWVAQDFTIKWDDTASGLNGVLHQPWSLAETPSDPKD